MLLDALTPIANYIFILGGIAVFKAIYSLISS